MVLMGAGGGPMTRHPGLWLPAFAESFTWLAWFSPICVFDCKTSLVSSTYLKVNRRDPIGLLARAIR